MTIRTLALLSIALALLVGCGGGGGGADEDSITLQGEALRDFLRPMLLTADDFPTPPATENDEAFFDELEDVPKDEIGTSGLEVEGADWLGTLTHGYFIPGPEAPTFAFPNAVIAFASAESAASWFGDLRDVYVEEFGTQLADQFPGSNLELEELDITAGEESWAFYLSGESAILDAPGELLSALVVFRRGPVAGIVGMTGFVPLDEPFLQLTAGLMDERIQDALRGR